MRTLSSSSQLSYISPLTASTLIIKLILVVTLLCSCSTAIETATDEAAHSSHLMHPHIDRFYGILTNNSYVFRLVGRADITAEHQELGISLADMAVDDPNEFYPLLCVVSETLQRCEFLYRNQDGNVMTLNGDQLDQLRTYTSNRRESLAAGFTHKQFKRAGLVLAWTIAPTTVFLQFASHNFSTVSKFFRKEIQLGLGVGSLVALALGTKLYLEHERYDSRQKITQFWQQQAPAHTPIPQLRQTDPFGISTTIYDQLLFAEEGKLEKLSMFWPMDKFTLNLAHEYNETLILYGSQDSSNLAMIHSRCFINEDTAELECTKIYPFTSHESSAE